MLVPAVLALFPTFLVAPAQAQITDLGVYYEPPLPALPTTGGTFVDPTFGTTILRVTDAATDGGGSCGTAYSYWPTFNRTSTRLWAFSARHADFSLWQMSASDEFAFTERAASGTAVLGYMAWARSTDTFPVDQATAQLDEVQIDKTGRWLLVKTGLHGETAWSRIACSIYKPAWSRT